MQSAKCRVFNEDAAGLRAFVAFHLSFCILHSAFGISPSQAQSIPPEFRIKRQHVFAFAEKPTVRVEGDRTEISFTTTAACDVTVAVEDGAGKIVRHLVSGVLGPSAPAPLARGPLRQTVVWDGKNDQGRYLDDRGGLSVRVSLGLRARFERALNCSPLKPPNYRNQGSLLCPAPEGVYVFTFGSGVSFLRLFDHDGNYVRTVYPPPADQIDRVRGLVRRTFPQTGLTYPARWGLNQNTFLTSGSLEAGAAWPESNIDNPATSLAVAGDRIALVHQRVNRLAPDGSTGPFELVGPRTSFDIPMSTVHTFPGGTYQAYPRSAAFSPDGRTLYLAGYHYPNPWVLDTLHGVARVDFAAGREASAEVFRGVMDKQGAGTGPDRFNFPTSVACDPAGRVYVSDYLNDRIQVFSPGGELLKSIPVAKPAHVAVHHRTGEIYVFSWYFRNSNLARIQQAIEEKRRRLRIESTMTRLGPFDDPTVRMSCPLPTSGDRTGQFGHPGEYFQVVLDSWAERDGGPPTIWLLTPEHYRYFKGDDKLPRVYVERDGKLEVKRNFEQDVVRATGRLISPRHGRVRVYANPADGRLYLGESHSLNAKSFSSLVRVDPLTGRHDIIELPFNTEDLAFDADGLAYLRTEDLVVRYDPVTWREVPFDYGVERKRIGYSPHSDARFADVTSAIDMPSVKPGWWIMGGLAVSPRGHVAVACHNPVHADARTAEQVLGRTSRFTPKLYPGRPTGWEIHVWDRHGRLVRADAAPGSRQVFGIGLDRDDSVYLMTPAQRVLPTGQPYPNDVSCTVVKFAAGQGRFVTGGGHVPVPLADAPRPDGPPQLVHGLYDGQAWTLDAQWLYGGVGNAAKYIGRAGGGCWCQYAQMTLDSFARTFVPEPDIYSVAVLDSAGNLVLRIGRYGNADDGLPLVRTGEPPGPASGSSRALSDTQGPATPQSPTGAGRGDEAALFNPQHVATHTDRRLYVSDIGNGRVVCVKLDYSVTERVSLK